MYHKQCLASKVSLNTLRRSLKCVACRGARTQQNENTEKVQGDSSTFAIQEG